MKGLASRIVDFDNKLPLILVGVLVGVVMFTMGEYQGWHFPHILHHKMVHFVANHPLMWIFFAYLGVEISIGQVVKSGRFAGLAILGGMTVPPLLAYILTGNIYIAIGAAATDVAFSLGAAKVLTKGNKAVLTLLVGALLLLAVGDDLGGIAIMAGVYANPDYIWLTAEVVILLFAYFVGERGIVNIRWRVLDSDGKPSGAVQRLQWVIEVESVVFWVLLALLNTIVLYFAGVEWLLGGCLVFIMAPQGVKHKLAAVMAPVVPFVLLIFGMVNGAIDLLDPKAWTAITAGCFFGGMMGKQIGIFGGGLVGRLLARRKGEHYGKIPISQVYGLALWGSCNGTVAIFFVVMAASKGYITPEQAAAATLGYFLTVPAVYIQTFIVGKLKIIRDRSDFKPLKEEVPMHPELDSGAEAA